MVKIAPSILSADFTRLGDEINDVETGGADYLHVDVMDGLFVPNISIGLPVVSSVRKGCGMVLDVHLMIDRPHRYIEDFCNAGADILVFHAEADQPQDIIKSLELIRALGKKAGLALRPKSPAAVLTPYLELLDLALVMTVEPGFGGQSFMSDQLPKIQELSHMISCCNPGCELEVDGGIDKNTAALVKNAGANVLVAGSFVFKAADRRAAIGALR